MQKSSPNVTNDFCSIDSETKEEIVTNLRNIYSDLTKGSDFTCTDHHDGCSEQNGNAEKDTSQYLYVGNEVFSYDCHCNYGGIRKDGKFLLQTLNGEEAIPVGVMRNYVKPTVMTLKSEVGPSKGGYVCPCTRCHKNDKEGNGLSCCSEVHPCCDCSLGEGHHCHINKEKIYEDETDDDLESELAKLPAWCRNNYIPDICTQTDVTKEIFIGRSKKKCCYPAPCPASCLDHLPKEEWLDVMPPRLYAMQPRKTYPC